MAMNLLQLCQAVADEVGGIDPPTSIINNSEQDARQLLQFTRRTGKELIRNASWQNLITEGTFTTLAADVQVNLKTQFPDYVKILPDTVYNRTSRRKVFGPITDEQWQATKSWLSVTADAYYRLRNNNFMIYGQSTAGQSIYLEYISNYWITDVLGATSKGDFTVDTDLIKLDEDAVYLGVKWRFLRAQGLPYSDERAEYIAYVTAVAGGDKSSETLSLNGGRMGHAGAPGYVNISVTQTDPIDGQIAFGGDLLWD